MSLVIDAIADLPVGIKHGVGGLLGRKIYVGLGSAGKQFFYFDLDKPELNWQSAPEFPGCAREDAAYEIKQGQMCPTCSNILEIITPSNCGTYSALQQ